MIWRLHVHLGDLLARRFKMDKEQDLGIGDSLMSKYQLLRMKSETVRRELLLHVYTKDKIDAKRMPHERRYPDNMI